MLEVQQSAVQHRSALAQVNCDVYHYLFEVRWSPDQDHYTLLGKIAVTWVKKVTSDHKTQ